MRIGSYGKPADAGESVGVGEQGSMANQPVGDDEPEVKVKEKPPTAASSILDGLESGFRRDVDELGDVVAPIKPYKERLADVGVTLEQARTVLDRLLLNGTHYAEDVKIGPNTYVRFRTRSYTDTMRTYRAIENEAPRYAATTDMIQIRYMLAASLEAYGDKTFEFPDSEDQSVLDQAFEKRLRFVMKLSEFAVQVLSREFGKFDRKISVILSDGAVEAF